MSGEACCRHPEREVATLPNAGRSGRVVQARDRSVRWKTKLIRGLAVAIQDFGKIEDNVSAVLQCHTTSSRFESLGHQLFRLLFFRRGKMRHDHLCRIDHAIKLFFGDEAEFQRCCLQCQVVIHCVMGNLG